MVSKNWLLANSASENSLSIHVLCFLRGELSLWQWVADEDNDVIEVSLSRAGNGDRMIPAALAATSLKESWLKLSRACAIPPEVICWPTFSFDMRRATRGCILRCLLKSSLQRGPFEMHSAARSTPWVTVSLKSMYFFLYSGIMLMSTQSWTLPSASALRSLDPCRSWIQR